MSNGQNQSGSGSRDHLQSEITHTPFVCHSMDPKPSHLLLTVENVEKLQEEYPVSKSALTRRSIEAYITQSNLFLNENETSTDGSKEQNLSDEKKSKSTSIVPQREDTCEDHSENVEEISKKDSQTRSPSTSVLKAQASKKHDVADLETQTEWSYSDGMDSTEKRRRKLDWANMNEKLKSVFVCSTEIKICSIGEGREEIEMASKESVSAEEEIHMETLFKAESHSITDLCHLGCCEFCTTMLRPLPTAEELDDKPDTMESFLCCRTYKDVFQCVVQELLETSSPESEIDITPHPHLSNTAVESRTKKTLMKEIQDRGFENYREVFEQYMKFGTCVKIRFKLSAYQPKPQTVALKQYPEPKEVLTIDLEFKAEQLKFCQPTKPVKRCYPDGKIFYFFFPDGTGQVYYPSGNIAILITYVKDIQFTYIILKDNSSYEMQAFFTNQGFAVCYHENGNIRLNLGLCFGSYFNQKGIRQKYWNWWDTSCHVHAPPFQPICIQLNVYIQVKIEAQDQIFLTFTKVHDCLQLNVGARLKLKDPNTLQFLQRPEISGQLSHSKILQIRKVLANLQKLLKKICSTPSEETKYLYHIISDLCDHMHCRRKMRIQPKQRHR
ncbi:glutamate-rich protein 6B [Rhineura floridana]|uniref:glutamate-rich protein 6B n=1 Tax=Rhineura floridana TaxID=261503 RepID=UPI002AC88B33|nr:glutamate-rich protein 6B [Rhineura floridana]